MKHLLISLSICLLSMTAGAQKAFTTAKDNETGAVIFKGPVTLAELREESSFGWFGRGEAAYTPDSAALSYLRKALPAHTMVVIMGTWCDDSHNLIPKLSKTLEAAQFPMNQLTMYGVDRTKQIEGIEPGRYNATQVPTIIVYKDNVEIGRIVESVKRNIETDLMQIISQSAGKH